GLAGGLVRRDDVGVLQSLGVHVLMRLDVRQRANAVAVDGRLLEFERRARRLHPLGQISLAVLAAAAQEVLRLADQRAIVLGRDAPDARRAAALDLVEQAGPGARREHGVGARAQQERAL